MRRSSKHAKVMPLAIQITGGLNLQANPIAIADNESPVMQNWYYPKGSDIPTVRPAVTCETATALSNPIDYLFHYTKNATTSYLMGVSDGDVYYYNSATNLWVDTTIDVNQKPCMCTFNGTLFIAHGATTLATWDGSSASTQSIDGTISPTVVTEINNRLVINDSSSGGLDLVCFSAVEDATGWTFTEVGGAVSLRAGYKDGSRVVALVKNFKNELIVFKQGDRAESIYRIQTLGAPYESSETAWAAEFVMGGQGASNAFCTESVDTAVLYLGRYGFSAIVADELYSELNNQAIGNKVNPIIGAVGNTNLELRYLVSSGQVWILRDDTEVYIYHPHNGKFTTYSFNSAQINSVTETSDGIYCAGDSGHLYKLSESEYQDEFTPSTMSDLNGVLKTKNFDLGSGGGLVKFSEFFFNPVLQGTNKIYFIDSTKNKQSQIDSHSNSGTFLNDFMEADLDFMGSSEYDFMGTDGEAWSQEVRKKWKGKRLQIQINTTGRCGFAEAVAQVALLGH